MYRLRKEEDKKNSYKQKLISERIVRQHVEAKFVGDIQRLTRLVETLKNEQKAYRNKIAKLEMVCNCHLSIAFFFLPFFWSVRLHILGVFILSQFSIGEPRASSEV